MTYSGLRTPLSLAVCLGAAFGFAESGDYYPPADKDGGWRTLTDAAKIRSVAGMDLSRLDQAFEFEKETSQHGGLVVVRHGYLVYEKYFGKGNREAHPDMASIGKAFTSISRGNHAARKTRSDSRWPRNQSFHGKIPAPSLSAGRSGEGGHQTRPVAFHVRRLAR